MHHFESPSNDVSPCIPANVLDSPELEGRALAPPTLPVNEADFHVLAAGMSGSAGPLRIEQHRSRGVPIFRRFLQTRGFDEKSPYDEFLRDRVSRVQYPADQVVALVAGYLGWCADNQLNVSSQLDALKFGWNEVGLDTSVLNHKSLHHLSKDSFRKRVRARDIGTEIMSREKMALSEEAIRWGFEKYAPNSLLEDFATVTLRQWDELMAWVAGMTSFNLGWRTGNFGVRVSRPAARRAAAVVSEAPVWEGADEDSIAEKIVDTGLLRAGDVCFRFVGSDEWVPSRRVPTVLGVGQWPVAVGLLLLQSKTNQLGGRPVRRVMGSDGVLQSRLVKAFAVLSVHGAHPAEETPFFSRPQHCALVSARASGLSTDGTVRKKMLASAVTEVAKAATAAVGLDPRRISAVSFKKSFVTQNFISGMTGAESAVATGHSSATVNEHYRAALLDRSGGALMALDTADGPCYTREMATLESKAFLQNR